MTVMALLRQIHVRLPTRPRVTSYACGSRFDDSASLHEQGHSIESVACPKYTVDCSSSVDQGVATVKHPIVKLAR